MNLPEIAQLAQQATNYLRPELLLLAGKAVEGAATESGKQIFDLVSGAANGQSSRSGTR